MKDESRASLTRLSKAVFSAPAKEGGEAAALAEQQSDVVNFVDAAISDVAASGRVSSKRISAPVVAEIASGSQAAVPMVSASAPETAETRVSSKRMPAPMVLAAAPEIEALENRGEAAVVENQQYDTVRMMSICAGAADGAEATVTGPEIEALAQDIAGPGLSGPLGSLLGKFTKFLTKFDSSASSWCS